MMHKVLKKEKRYREKQPVAEFLNYLTDLPVPLQYYFRLISIISQHSNT